MLRIGYCTNLLATQADGTGREWIEKGRGIGFDYVELPLAQMMDLNEEEFLQDLWNLLAPYFTEEGRQEFELLRQHTMLHS